jgi:hypothetical protein
MGVSLDSTENNGTAHRIQYTALIDLDGANLYRSSLLKLINSYKQILTKFSIDGAYIKIRSVRVRVETRALRLVLRRSSVRTSVQNTGYPDLFCCFPQCVQESGGIVPRVNQLIILHGCHLSRSCRRIIKSGPLHDSVATPTNFMALSPS